MVDAAMVVEAHLVVDPNHPIVVAHVAVVRNLEADKSVVTSAIR